MNTEKYICKWANCDNKKSETQTYINCDKCGASVGPIYWNYCDKHRIGRSEKTDCRYMIPWMWSCYKCYPEDFENWKPDLENYPDTWSEELKKLEEKLKTKEFDRKISRVWKYEKNDNEDPKLWYKDLKETMGAEFAIKFVKDKYEEYKIV